MRTLFFLILIVGLALSLAIVGCDSNTQPPGFPDDTLEDGEVDPGIDNVFSDDDNVPPPPSPN